MTKEHCHFTDQDQKSEGHKQLCNRNKFIVLYDLIKKNSSDETSGFIVRKLIFLKGRAGAN